MKLGEMIDAYGWKHKKSLRTIAKEIGISPATMSRIQTGNDCDIKTLMLLINWIMK